MTRADALRRAAAKRLAAAGADEADLDARLLLQRATGWDRATLAARGDEALSDDIAARFDALVARRQAREPLSYILGARGFWSLELAVTRDVLTPRPETELVVEALLAGAPAPERVLDLGTGSGAILLALLVERPGAWGVGIDASRAALKVAQANAVASGVAARVAFVCGDWDASLDGAFDLVACNPPYVATAELAALAPEVRDFEPRQALDGGADGLDAYRRLAPGVARLLRPGGLAAFEIGWEQGDAVASLLAAQPDIKDVEVRRDLSERDRVVTARRTG